jgi:large subunit ribosomal protein L32
MAVPKKKTSKSKRNMRRSHDSLKCINVVVDPITGEYKLPHQLSKVDGTYNGRKVVVVNDNNNYVDETEAETL